MGSFRRAEQYWRFRGAGRWPLAAGQGLVAGTLF